MLLKIKYNNVLKRKTRLFHSIKHFYTFHFSKPGSTHIHSHTSVIHAIVDSKMFFMTTTAFLIKFQFSTPFFLPND